MKDYVLSRVFDPLLVVADQHEIAEIDLVRDLSFTHADIRDSHYLRIPWNEYALYCQRLEDLAGPKPIDELGKLFPQITSFLPFMRLGGMLTGPKWFYDVSKLWFGPTMFPVMVTEEYEEIRPRTLKVVLSIPDELSDCPQFFRAIASFDREGPTLLGMEPASVQMHLMSRRAEYVIHYPPSNSLPARLQRGFKALFASKSLFDEYALQHENLMASYDAAQRSDRSFRDMVERSPDAIAVYDEQQIHYVNDAMKDLLGGGDPVWPAGQPFDSICRNSEAVIAQGNARNGESSPLQTVFIRDNGQELQGEVKTISIHFEGKPAYVSVMRDVTLRNDLLARAMEMDRIISMGMLAAEVGHEISNPLAYVHTNLDYLREIVEEDDLENEDLEDVANALKASIKGVERIQTIARDLSTFARAPAENLEPVQLAEALQPSLHWIEKELRDRARLELDLQSSVFVLSNANRIAQVALNLLVNAAHAIEAGSPDANVVRVSTFCDDHRAYLKIEDTGCGIPEELQDKIFDPFFTTKAVGEGTGLGLFLTRKIVDHLQGTLTVESSVDEGTSVCVGLPLYDT